MLNPIEEAKFAELKEKCRELGVPTPPEIFIGLKVHDKNGVLTFDDVQRGHSWTRNYWNFFFAFMTASFKGTDNTYGVGHIANKATSGQVYGANGLNVSSNWLTTAFGNVEQGIIVGTGDTAFSAEQYAIAALIEHGTDSGQLNYLEQLVPVLDYTAGTKVWRSTHTRSMYNVSGALITVKETALYSHQQFFVNIFTNMHERSVLSPVVDVANGAELTVTYEISMDFTAID